MKKAIYTINISLILITILLLSFIMYVLYSVYLKPKSFSLIDIIKNTNLQNIKTNGQHLPNEIEIKNKLKKEYQNLLVDKIKINIDSATTARVTSADHKIYHDSVNIFYTLDKSLENQIDLNQTYQPNPTLIKQRGYKGLWINNNKQTIDEKNITNAFLSTSKYYKLPYFEKQEFNSYEELINFLNLEIKTSWEYIVNNFCITYKEKIKKLIVLFYNVFTNIFKKNNINNILNKIEIKELDAHGYAYHRDKHIELNTYTINCDYANTAIYEWTNGFKTSNSIFSTLFHEIGHIIHFYSLSRNINPIEHLKEFLVKKINNSQNLDREKIFQLFHLSEYSFKNSFEFFAEGFSYWFLTNDTLKTKAWEFWHEFLTLYLPKKLN